jgi:hypothetical protein
VPPAPRPGVLPWLVGAFALWQLAFFPLANLSEFVPQRPGPHDVNPPIESSQRWGRFTDREPVQAAAEVAGHVLASWAELTGQDQGWVMFTPGFPPYTVTLAAEFHFPDGTTDRIESRFEPGPAGRFRFPVVHDRAFNHEANIFMLAWHGHPRSFAEQPEVWRQLPERVRENDALVTRWLAWRAKQYAAAHPDRPTPTAVVAVLRYRPTPPPDDPAAPPGPAFDRPLARWLPGGPAGPGWLPLEGYDPIGGRWVRLKPWGRP